MTVILKARRGRGFAVAALVLAATAFASGETRSQPVTLDQLASSGGSVDPGEFPLVPGDHTIRTRFYQKRSFTTGDGVRRTLALYRAWNCWLREKTDEERAAVVCGDKVGPPMIIPVLFVTPASRPKSGSALIAELELRRSRTASLSRALSLADYAPARFADGAGPPAWIRLRNPAADSLAMTAPAAPAALVVCVPAAECGSRRDILVSSLDDTLPEAAKIETAAVPPATPVVPAPPPAAPPRSTPPAPAAPPAASAGETKPPPAAVPLPSASPPPAAASVSPPSTPPPSVSRPSSPPPATLPPAQPSPAPAPAAAPSPSPPAPPGQLHYVVRPAASSMLAGWTPERMTKRLLALAVSTGSRFALKTQDGRELESRSQPELSRSGDAVVAWSGNRPEGPAELILSGFDGVEIVSRPPSAAPQTAPAALVNPRVRNGDFVNFGEFKISAPFLYDQWVARIEAVTKIYGQEQPDSADDFCRFSLRIPGNNGLSWIPRNSGWLAFLARNRVDLQWEDEGDKRMLASPPVILPAQLKSAAGQPLYLDVRPTDADPACISQNKRLPPVTTAAGNATAAWKLTELPGSPSTGRIEIRPSSLTTRGRFLLGLYAPQNIGAGADLSSGGATEARDQIFASLTAFLDGLRERNFLLGRPAGQAIASDLALIGSADGDATAFSEKNVIAGKFRQPPPANDGFQTDDEGRRRLTAFLSASASAGGDVSLRAVGQTIRHYTHLFGDFSGGKPPIAIYVGAAHPGAETCQEWQKMTADVASLPGRPRVFALLFSGSESEQTSRQLGHSSRGDDLTIAPGVRGFVCNGGGGSTLLFAAFPDLLTHPPAAVLDPAFRRIEQWAGRVEQGL